MHAVIYIASSYTMWNMLFGWAKSFVNMDAESKKLAKLQRMQTISAVISYCKQNQTALSQCRISLVTYIRQCLQKLWWNSFDTTALHNTRCMKFSYRKLTEHRLRVMIIVNSRSDDQQLFIMLILMGNSIKHCLYIMMLNWKFIIRFFILHAGLKVNT